MSVENPYETLGIREDASFEEIQDAKNRLSQTYREDVKLVESIEEAYDAIIMERLRLRQEGKLDVPEGIRYPERKIAAPLANGNSAGNSPAWLQRFLDTPSGSELAISSGLYLLLSVVILLQAPESSRYFFVAHGFGFASSVYLLNRKENRFARSLVMTLASFVLGIAIGTILAPIAGNGIAEVKFATLVAFFFLWLTTSFLR